jgi:hypothetical protein
MPTVHVLTSFESVASLEECSSLARWYQLFQPGCLRKEITPVAKTCACGAMFERKLTSPYPAR